jgi:hypothetical protein
MPSRRFRCSGGSAIYGVLDQLWILLPDFEQWWGAKTMHWTNTGTRFQTFPTGPTLSGIVSSQDHRGTTRLPAGRYRLYIDAAPPEEPMGSWTIIIR